MTLIKCKKSDLVQELLRLGDKPYDLKDRAPLAMLYDLAERDVLLMMGRQYGKSTFLASDSLADVAAIPFFNILYVSPRQDQTTEFSNAKLLPFIKFSPLFRELCIDPSVINNVGKKTFSTGSGITLKYAFHSADAIRGVSADKVTIDEIQDIIYDNVAIIEECLSGSPYQWRAYAGTPKTLNNTLARKWFSSTQNEWVLKCPHCNVWNIIMIENIGPEGLICKKCKKDLPRDSRGEWISKYKIGDTTNGIFLSGFRIPQVLSPTVQWKRIIEKQKTMSSAQFMNEVMALPFDNSANPISEAELRDSCAEGMVMVEEPSPAYRDTHLFMGVDWGHGDISLSAKKTGKGTGYTVVTIGYLDWDGRFKVLFMKKFTGAESDPQYQVKWVIDAWRKYNITCIGVDWGAGFLHNAELKHGLGKDRIIEWQAHDSLRVSAKWEPLAERMMYNRTDCMTDRFVEIKNKSIVFPDWKQFKEFAQDFLTICVQYRSNGTMYYDHVQPDDAFHSYMICKMTCDHILKSHT